MQLLGRPGFGILQIRSRFTKPIAKRRKIEFRHGSQVEVNELAGRLYCDDQVRQNYAMKILDDQ